MIRAGLCELDITPRLGSMIPGNFNTRLAEGVLDPLYTKALVLESGEQRVAIVAADCLGIYDDAADKFRVMLEKRTGITHAVFAATHTHTGGPVQSWGDHITKDEAYVDFLIGKSVDAAIMAIEKLRPVKLRAGKEREDGIAFNRRFHMKDGSVRTNPGVLNPDIVRVAGPVDPDVSVLRIDDENGSVIGVLTNFSCHLDNVGGRRLSADYAGELSRVLKSVYGDQTVSLFLTGPCGDINNIDITGKFPKVPEIYKKMGKVLAGKVLAAAEKAPIMENSEIVAVREIIECACRLPSKEDAEAGRALIAIEKRSQDELIAAKDGSLENLFYAKEAVRMFENPVTSEKLDITALRVGDVAIVTIPAELFVEFSLEIKGASPFANTVVSSLSNGMVGYVLTPEAIFSGSYESRLASSAKMSAQTGSAIADTAKRLLCSLYNGRPSKQEGI